jgi:LmbE family N-acetylglucosaminyl deacetylase
MQYTQNDIKKLGTILGVWAHPDDESWCSAGLMKMATLNGQKVGILTATKGDAGQTANPELWPQEKLADIRTRELHDCLCEIGDVQQFWLDYNDGELIHVDQKAAINNVLQLINTFRPDTIITFEHHGITGHDDHKTIHTWAHEAAKKSKTDIRVLCAVETREKFEEAGEKLDGSFNIFFNTDKPRLIDEHDADVLIKLPAEVLECKLCCLKAHASQTSKIFSQKESIAALRIMAGTECFVSD